MVSVSDDRGQSINPYALSSSKKLIVFSCHLECGIKKLISQGAGFDVYHTRYNSFPFYFIFFFLTSIITQFLSILNMIANITTSSMAISCKFYFPSVYKKQCLHQNHALLRSIHPLLKFLPDY